LSCISKTLEFENATSNIQNMYRTFTVPSDNTLHKSDVLPQYNCEKILKSRCI